MLVSDSGVIRPENGDGDANVTSATISIMVFKPQKFVVTVKVEEEGSGASRTCLFFKDFGNQ